MYVAEQALLSRQKAILDIILLHKRDNAVVIDSWTV